MSTILNESLTTSALWCILCAAMHFFWSFSSPYIITGFAETFKEKRSLRIGWYNRAVSTFHATAMFSLTMYYWIYMNPEVQISHQKVTVLETVTVDIMMGYLWYDIIFELLHTRQLDSLGHHVLGLISHLSTRLSGNTGASFTTMLVFIAEGSTPWLNISWLMHQLHMKYTVVFKLTALTLLLAFFLCRTLLGPYMVQHMLFHRAEWGSEGGKGLFFWGNFSIVSSFAVLNFYWFSKLLQVAFGKSSTSAAPAKKKK